MLFKSTNQSSKNHTYLNSAEPEDCFKKSGLGLLASVKPSLLTRLITYLHGSNKIIKEAAG